MKNKSRRRRREKQTGSISFNKGSGLKNWRMAWLRNGALEQLGHKIKEEEIIWAATCAQQKHQYPSRTLCYSVSLALQAPQAVKKEKPDNREIRVRDAKQLCAEIRKERADELAGVGMANNAARKRRAMAVLKSALAKQ